MKYIKTPHGRVWHVAGAVSSLYKCWYPWAICGTWLHWQSEQRDTIKWPVCKRCRWKQERDND